MNRHNSKRPKSRKVAYRVLRLALALDYLFVPIDGCLDPYKCFMAGQVIGPASNLAVCSRLVAGVSFFPAQNWLSNLKLAGNQDTRIQYFF